MNKKVLSAILFSALFAGTGTFTSCIDTDEPAGIEELRGAKAELIRAKVAVAEADAAFTLAQAEVQKAEAAIKNAMAKYEAARADSMAAAAEYAAAATEQAKEMYKIQLDSAVNAAKEAALDHQKNMLVKQESLAKAERSYELVLKQIEIAKAVSSEKQMVTIATLESQLLAAKVQYDGAVEKLRLAENARYTAAINADNETGWEIGFAEWALKYAKADLAVAEKTLAKYAEFEKNEGAETADWRAEVEEIDDSLEVITKKLADITLEKTEALYTKEYKAYVDAVYAAEKAEAAEYDTLKTKFVLPEAVSDTLIYTTTLTSTPADQKNYVVSYGKDKNKVTEVLEQLAGANYLGFNGDSTEVTVADKFNANGIIAKLQNEHDSYTKERAYWLDSVAAMDETAKAKAKNMADSVLNVYNRAKAAYLASTHPDTLAAMKNRVDAIVDTFDDDLVAASKADSTKLINSLTKELKAWYAAGAKNGMTINNVVVGNTYDSATGAKVYTAKPVTEFLGTAANFLKLYEVVGTASYFTTKQTTGANESYKNGATKVPSYETGAINKEYDDSYLAELQNATKLAFGDFNLYDNNSYDLDKNGYLHNVPDTVDIKYVVENNTNLFNQTQSVTVNDIVYTAVNKAVGVYGYYIYTINDETQFLAKNHKAIKADLAAAVTKWTALVNEIVEDAKAAVADIKAADAAVTLANTNLTAYGKTITDKYELAEAELKGEQNALNGIRAALVTAIEAYLGETYTDAAAFSEWLTEKVKWAEFDVLEAEALVKQKENNLKQAQDGKFTQAEALADAERELAAAEEVLAEAEKELKEAMANLEKGLAIMAGTSAE